eukprot:2525259-Rhodomonas_salina.3
MVFAGSIWVHKARWPLRLGEDLSVEAVQSASKGHHQHAHDDHEHRHVIHNLRTRHTPRSVPLKLLHHKPGSGWTAPPRAC